MFPFDIREFLDEDDEAEVVGEIIQPILDETRAKLLDVADRLNASLDALVVDCGSIRSRFHDIQAHIPDKLADMITLAANLEQHEFKYQLAMQRLADRRERQAMVTTVEASR